MNTVKRARKITMRPSVGTPDLQRAVEIVLPLLLQQTPPRATTATVVEFPKTNLVTPRPSRTTGWAR